MSNPTVTGQIIFRETGANAPTHDGRKLMMLVGVIAVPENFPFKGEHQYTISSGTGLVFIALPESEIDRTQECRGNDLGDMMMEPIWRC